MEKPKGHQLLTFIAAFWCTTSNVVAASETEVLVQGEVYCEGVSQHHEGLKDAKVQVDCANHGTQVATTNAQGRITIHLQNYDYQKWGINGCKARLISNSHASCTTPTNIGASNLVLKENSKEKVVLTAGPFTFKQLSVKDLQKRVETKESSGLWYSPPHHKSREKDCSPKREKHHHKAPVYHSPPLYHKSPPYHSEHPRRESSPYYKSPPHTREYSPPQHSTFPPPVEYNHMSPPYVHHTPPPKEFFPPPYYQSSNVHRAAP